MLSLACAGGAKLPAAAPVPRGHPRVAAGIWKASLAGPHPRLFGPPAYLKQLAADKPALYQQIKVQNDTLSACVVQAIEGLPKDTQDRYVARAMSAVNRGVTNVHQDTWSAMQRVAVTFDSFHDAISPEDRQAIIDWLNAHLGVYVDDEGAFHNSTMAKSYCYLQVAYATWGENPRAQEFRDYAIKKLYESKLVPAFKEFGAGGGYTEGGWYTRHCVWPLLQALELARRMEGYDGIAKAPAFFYQRLAYEFYESYPGVDDKGRRRFAMEGDGKVIYSKAMEYPRLISMALAQYFRGSELAGYEAAGRKPTTSPEFMLDDFLYEESPDAPRDVKDVPLAHLSAGIGRVYARSDWGDDATWLRFECGDFFAQHQHFEAGNFEIFRREPLATESGLMSGWSSPQTMDWSIRTIAHNCILVYKEGQTWPTLLRDPKGRLTLANDGGQANSTFVADTVEAWRAKYEKFHRGTITAYENQPEFVYVSGDYAAAYDKTKVSSCTRQIVFVRPCTFVILDRVTSVKAEYHKTWLLHSHNEPRIDGQDVRIENGAGRLFVQTLLPEAASIRKVEGYTYDGRTFNSRVDQPSSRPASSPSTGSAPSTTSAPRRRRNVGDTLDPDIENLWRIEVQPADATTKTVFLHVLSTADNPEKAQLVRKGKLVGARGADWEVLFDDANSGTVTISGKGFPLSDKVIKGKYE